MSAVPSLLALYGSAVREQSRAAETERQARIDHEFARNRRQDLWRQVKEAVANGTIKRGIHMTGSGSAVIVDLSHDYPEVFPLFKSDTVLA